MLIKDYEATALQSLTTLHGALGAIEADTGKETIRDAMEAALRLTEAVGDLSGVLISMLDRIDGDADLEAEPDLEDGYDREDDRVRHYAPIYGIDQSKGVIDFKDLRKQ